MSRGFKAGTTVGRYKLISSLGSGGNGEVWRAAGPDGDVAVKFLHARHADPDGSRYKRFRDEIEVLNRLKDRPGILPLLESSFLPNASQAESAWFAMPLATGIVDALGPAPSLDSVVSAVAVIADTLASLHAEDVSHRDLKPSNMY